MSTLSGINLGDVVEQAIRNVYDRKLKAGDLDANTWAANVAKMWLGVKGGYGVTTSYQHATDNELAAALRQNLYVFAAFKNHHNVGDLVALLTDEQGNLRPFDEFRRLALQVSENYNVNWLAAEYDTAVASGQAAAKWQDIQRTKKALPMIRYITAGDERVRLAHQLLEGITLPVDDPFWDEWFPPNGWRCRCDVMQVSGPIRRPGRLPSQTEVPPSFRNNPGKSGQVFTLDHPYFQTVKPEYRTRIMRAAARLIYDNYPAEQYLKTAASAAAHFRDLHGHLDAPIGYDQVSGGFVVINHDYSPVNITAQLPMLRLLRDQGGMVELLENQGLFWDGNFWTPRVLKAGRSLGRAVARHFAGSGPKLMLHISINLATAELREYLYDALRQNPSVKLVQLVMKSGRLVRLTAEQIRARDWK